jgi:RNA polymerase sigma factor (sigma-70 family)
MSDLVWPDPDVLGVPASIVVRPTFESLYAREFQRMVRLAFVFVDTVEEAEEVVQDAFAAMLPRFPRLTEPEAYLRRCVLNRARQVLRRRRLVRRQPSPAAEEQAIEFNHVLDAVRRLPHRQRSVVVLRFELQLSEAEIAAAMKMPAGTVKSTLHRALTRLRLEIEQ